MRFIIVTTELFRIYIKKSTKGLWMTECELLAIYCWFSVESNKLTLVVDGKGRKEEAHAKTFERTGGSWDSNLLSCMHHNRRPCFVFFFLFFFLVKCILHHIDRGRSGEHMVYIVQPENGKATHMKLRVAPKKHI